MVRSISFTLNGKSVRLTVDDERMLLSVLRYDLGLAESRQGCSVGQCGACTVLLDDQAVRACTTPMKEVARRRLLTVEGLRANGAPQAIRQLLAPDALTCSRCSPGIILRAHALLQRNPRPTRAQVVAELNGNLCHCGSHLRVLDAIESEARSEAAEARHAATH